VVGKTLLMWQMNRKYPLAVCFWLLVLGTCSGVQADWIKPIMSARAGIDSIERVLVIRDVDSLQLFGKQMLDLGDIAGGPGHELLITRWESANDSSRAFIYYGGTPLDGNADLRYVYLGRNLRAVGDLNRDGYTDFAQWHLPLQPQIDFDIFWGGPLFDNLPDMVIPNHFSLSYDAVDLDGDGVLELPVIRDINALAGVIDIYKTGALFDTIPNYIITDTSVRFGFDLCTGDFNGDGFGDIAVSADYGLSTDSAKVYVYFGGRSFDTTVDLIIRNTSQDPVTISNFGRFVFNVGDFNVDGFDDLLICPGSNAPGGLYMGSANFDGTLDVIVNQYRGGFGYFPPTDVERAGDINHDGYPDFIIGYVAAPWRYEAHLYLGGPDVKQYMPADIWIEESMIPGALLDFGEAVAGIGDFTGDGIDDIAVRSRTGYGPDTWWGEVNIFAGWKSSQSDVPLDRDKRIPDDFSLMQNYPNPFNGSTVIKFGLSRRAQATLTIFNLSGRLVRTIVNQSLPAGSYRATWDGTDSLGKPVASGVYLYRLKLGEQSFSRKMSLLK